VPEGRCVNCSFGMEEVRIPLGWLALRAAVGIPIASPAGHSVQVFSLGEAVSVMRKSVAITIVPVGWPPLVETLERVAARHITIYACGACCRARFVTEVDLNQWGARFGSPAIFVSLVEWADRIITE